MPRDAPIIKTEKSRGRVVFSGSVAGEGWEWRVGRKVRTRFAFEREGDAIRRG